MPIHISQELLRAAQRLLEAQKPERPRHEQIDAVKQLRLVVEKATVQKSS